MDERVLAVAQMFGCPPEEAAELVAKADAIKAEMDRQLATVRDLAERFGVPTVEVGCQVRVPCRREQVATVTEESPEGGRWRLVWWDGRATRFAWWDTASLEVVASRGDVEQSELDRADAYAERMRP